MALRNKQHQKARALKMLEARIMQGKTQQEIAKDFGVSPRTVEKAMSLAAKGDLLISFEDKLMNELLPLAHTALVGALQEGNAKVALELYKGTNILRKNAPLTSTQMQQQDDLTAYIATKRHHALLEEQTIDGTILTDPMALPAATESPDAPADSATDGPAESAPSGPESGGADGPSLHGVAEAASADPH